MLLQRNVRCLLAGALLGSAAFGVGCRSDPDKAARERTHDQSRAAYDGSPGQADRHEKLQSPVYALPCGIAAHVGLLTDGDFWISHVSSGMSKLSRAADRLNTSPSTHIDAGLRAAAREDYELALACFERSLALSPTDETAMQLLSEALIASEEYAGAIKVCEELCRKPDADPVARFNLAVLLTRFRRFDRAEAIYRDLIAKEAEDIRARYNLASLYQAQGKLGQAADQWQRLLAIDDQLPSAHGALGEILMMAGEPTAAARHYASAATAQPDNVIWWANLAEASRMVGDYGRALVAIQRAIQLAPDSAMYLNRLAEIQVEIHRALGRHESLEDAVAAWRRSLQIDPSQEQVRRLLETYAGPVSTYPHGR